MREPDKTDLALPDFSLVVLIGSTGSGKSSFAAKHFLPTEVISSDRCRALVSDDETNQDVSADAFELMREIVGKRLKHRKLAVVDATNVRAADRKAWIELARKWHALPVAVVIDPGVDVCIARNAARPDRQFGAGVAQRMTTEIRKGLGGLQREGFRQVWKLGSEASVDAAKVSRQPLWTDKRDDSGPFDIIGDIHGCADELQTLLGQLGYSVAWSEDRGDRTVVVTPPEGRKAVFVGDIVDRGPNSPDALRIVMGMVAAGTAYCVQGNHERKLGRWLEGRKVTVAHGLQQTIDQLDAQDRGLREALPAFLDGLRSHVWLDGGRLAVAHAGLKEEMIGRGSGAVREFALYGETTGEIDEFGLPVRADWATAYRGKTAVIYGHTPMLSAEWLNNTLCIDTGCVFGGKLTALRWPERELVEVPAIQVWSEPIRPLGGSDPGKSAQADADGVLDYQDVSGRRWIETELRGRIVVAEENAAAALEVMSRFALAPQWLVYLPPTMSPSETSNQSDWLERPEEAFAHFRERGVAQVVCEEKHMGSRAVIALCRNARAARERFGVSGNETGAIWTRTGRSFFKDTATTEGLLARLRASVDAADLWNELSSDWLLLDAEIMPWSAKAGSLIESQYAPVATSSAAGFQASREALARALARGVDAAGLNARFDDRAARATKYATAWAPYVWPVTGIDDLKVAPFHLLASEGHVWFDKDHVWHMTLAARLTADDGVVTGTRWRTLDLADANACAETIAWWEALTGSGGEGMVVKPRDFVSRGKKGLIQPALKVRGREYLRIIYGPEYDAQDNLVRLRERGLGGKRSLAHREFALGHEALKRFVAQEPLRRVHECVFGVLALESEPIDPRL
ncbi:polynucleotide kinase-phosphatase [Mesorhizobium sp. M4A.F.Ca.ET.020.02.1.1]|uniref:polynucleotide kinase-phosphatase n=2 Tax=Mesorhizobium TaxID=68287 RepID=UPI000FD2C912|nr:MULTISPECIES: polynucleotide kinase-phosphatase [unclassified Mesorhizobium]RVD43328.1 polynucleotide kinase-phosphatase [Mesorhizobium sp. M4A.F.Ca.ET.020.02.1.1]RWC16122.1 MAG: polynucleotide kinase-phosphatase [Mesorhizobium sp.]RWD31668.1 MAG: polynucleotide kinase-phosphatase [Mesorhizobium sp.]TJW68279.1 MAG: polynucleotide kinase-phosphatase [Mesorhizobium sp.]